jgi:hypothetical protein
VLSPTANDDESDDARTVINSETVDLPHRPVTTAEVDGRATSNTTGIGIDSPELRRPVQNLGVIEIIAYCWNKYTAQLNGEVKYKSYDHMFDVQQFSRSRYGGRLRYSKNAPGMWTQFDRGEVELLFELRHPLQVRTVEAFNSPDKRFASYSRGEIFIIKAS